MNRRQFVLKVIPCAVLAGVALKATAETTIVDPASEVAKALKYVVDASQVDVSNSPTYKKGQKCEACQLYSPLDGRTDVGECGAFPNQLVTASGWCAAYA